MSASKKLILRSVQFQGANGFPMAMYRPVLSLMRTRVLALLDNKGYEVENKSNFSISGCDLFPYVHTGEDWTAMVQHLEKEVEQKSEGAEKNPLIFMGHSFGGGALSALAARRPDLVHGIVLIEPPLFSIYKRFTLALLSKFISRSLAEKYHPIIEAALRKQSIFNSRSEAREHFSKRRVFSAMDSEVFDIFINECLVAYDKDGKCKQVTLLQSTKEEAEVYHRVPYDIPLLSKHFLNQYGMNTPGKYYYTNHKTSILQPSDYKWVRSNFKQLQCIEYNESHFWPLENIDNFTTMMAKDIVEILVSDDVLVSDDTL